MPKIVAQVRSMPGEFFLRAEVADALDVSSATLRRLATRSTLLVPTTSVMTGMLAVPVYDAETVARLHAHLAEHRSPRGRPRLWSDAERSARRAAHSTAGYRRRRAVALRERGDHAGAKRMLVDAEQISTALQCGYRDRQQQSRTCRA